MIQSKDEKDRRTVWFMNAQRTGKLKIAVAESERQVSKEMAF